MRIFDSHCHLDDASYSKDLAQVIARARQAGVKAMMVVGIDKDTSRRAIAIAQAHDGIHASVGLHPHDARHCDEQVLTDLCRLADHPKVKAWGETGLDFNRMHSPRADQERCFTRQLEIGGQRDVPMIFHERDSGGRFLQLLKPHWRARRSGVVHCFSGSDAELDSYLALGLYIGVTGILTVHSRGAQLRAMVGRIPADRLLVETDAPYLTPTPERNKHRRNEPAFVGTVLNKLADVLGQPVEELAEITWANTCRLFDIDA
ncbi:MAG: TatD family hydrolase [Desulfatitalea sp.]|nr:TatD family hydrolase [Desulfatitalea sp.]NNK01605.1 TatD family hydrolase [Desulfatitalea sp.]